VEGLAPTEVGSRRARRLLAGLACGSGAPQPIERLIDVVWGDEPPERAAEQLGVLVSRLRASLGAERIERRGGGLQLHADWSDLAEVRALAERAAARHQDGDTLGAHLAAGMALDLVRGPLLPDHEGAWVEAPRAAAHRLAESLRGLLAGPALLDGDLDLAWLAAEGSVELGEAGAAEVAAWVAFHRQDLDAALAYAEEGAASSLASERRASCLALAGRVLHTQGRLSAAEHRLAEAAQGPAGVVRTCAEVWLAALRNHQGRPSEALALLGSGPSVAAVERHPHLLPQSLFGRVHALGQMGEVAAAFLVLDEWRAALDAMGAAGDRHRPTFHNCSAWLLSAVGVLGDAKQHRRRCLELAPPGSEAANHALLDLASAALDAGDVAEAERWLERLVADDDPASTMAWRQQQRLDLLRSRLAMGEGYPSLALDLAEQVATAARSVGALRTAWLADVQAELVVARAEPGAGSPERIERALQGLDEVGGLEGWRAPAALAGTTGRADLRDAARERSRRLVERSGDWAEMVAAYTSAEIDRLLSGPA
jgi:tetratricopeptide (TPR) repeat protein